MSVFKKFKTIEISRSLETIYISAHTRESWLNIRMKFYLENNDIFLIFVCIYSNKLERDFHISKHHLISQLLIHVLFYPIQAKCNKHGHISRKRQGM